MKKNIGAKLALYPTPLTAEEVASLEVAADQSGVESVQFWESKME